MNADDLLKHYPGCEMAISYCEYYLMDPDEEDGMSGFDWLRACNSLSDALHLLKLSVLATKQESTPRWKEVLDQMDHPNFKLYLAARLGAV